MSFKDKSIQCSDCGATFTHSVEDQEFFQSKGYTNEPKRYPSCRQARKSERTGSGSYGSGDYGSPRQMFTATCASYTANRPKYPSSHAAAGWYIAATATAK
jgi:hypothetical protein